MTSTPVMQELLTTSAAKTNRSETRISDANSDSTSRAKPSAEGFDEAYKATAKDPTQPDQTSKQAAAESDNGETGGDERPEPFTNDGEQDVADIERGADVEDLGFAVESTEESRKSTLPNANGSIDDSSFNIAASQTEALPPQEASQATNKSGMDPLVLPSLDGKTQLPEAASAPKELVTSTTSAAALKDAGLSKGPDPLSQSKQLIEQESTKGRISLDANVATSASEKGFAETPKLVQVGSALEAIKGRDLSQQFVTDGESFEGESAIELEKLAKPTADINSNLIAQKQLNSTGATNPTAGLVANNAPLAISDKQVGGPIDMMAPLVDGELGGSQAQTRIENSVVLNSPVPQGQLAKNVAQQIAYAVAQSGNGATEIKLSPEELGRVRMIVQAVEGVVTISVSAERAETGELMRRHAEVLSQELREQGFSTINLSFGDSSSAEHSHDETSEQFAQIDAVEATDNNHIQQARVLITTQGLDLRL